jgi:hypothetical protein
MRRLVVALALLISACAQGPGPGKVYAWGELRCADGTAVPVAMEGSEDVVLSLQGWWRSAGRDCELDLTLEQKPEAEATK